MRRSQATGEILLFALQSVALCGALRQFGPHRGELHLDGLPLRVQPPMRGGRRCPRGGSMLWRRPQDAGCQIREGQRYHGWRKPRMRWRIALAIFAPIAAVSGVAAVVTRAEPTTNGAATTGTAAERAPSAKQFTTEAFLKHYYETLDLTYRERKFLHHAREDCIELVHKRFSRVHAGVPALADELTSPQSTLGLLTASEQAAQQFVRDAMQRYLGLDGHLHALADEIDNTLRSRAEQEARERCRRLEEALQAAGVAENGLAAARNAFWENLAVTVPSVVTQAAESASAQRVAAAATAAVAAGAGTAATLVMTGVRFSWLTGAGSILLGTAAGIAYFLFNRDDCRATVEHEIIQAIEPLEQQFKDKACTRVHEVTQALFEHIRTAETQAVTATLAQASRQR